MKRYGQTILQHGPNGGAGDDTAQFLNRTEHPRGHARQLWLQISGGDAEDRSPGEAQPQPATDEGRYEGPWTGIDVRLPVDIRHAEREEGQSRNQDHFSAHTL